MLSAKGLLSCFLVLSAIMSQAQDFKAITDHISAPCKALDLSGEWQASPALPSSQEIPQDSWRSVTVPGKHSGLFTKEKDCVYFRKDFNLTESRGQKVFAAFERVTDRAEVFVNGQRAGESEDGYFPFKIDISAWVKEGSNSLVVKVYGTRNVSGKRPEGMNWLYAQFVGMPFPVHVETRGEVYTEDVFIQPSAGDVKSLKTEITVRNGSSSEKDIEVIASCGKEFSHQPVKLKLKSGESRKIAMNDLWANPKLWTPDSPNLYYMDIKISSGGKLIDFYRQRFGFREIKVQLADIFLNGMKLLHRRCSLLAYIDQNKEETMDETIKLLRERGFNGYRLHLGSSYRIIRKSDEAGWLVCPESGLCSPKANEVEPEFWAAAEKHLLSMVGTFKNNPSVIYWALSNEFAGTYMKGTDEEKFKANMKMCELGKKVETADPTRIWTCSGDVESGAVREHGPAPALSFHYAWQPAKIHNMLPNTAYWLTDGMKPWQGVAWDQKKPIMLSEDLYPPYSLNPPYGMASWAGDRAFDLDKGFYDAWADAYRMLCDGYYYAGISVWNPWGSGETIKENPLFKNRVLMPSFHISVPDGSNFYSDQLIEKRLKIYNQTFTDEDLVLCSLMGEENKGKTAEFRLKGGDFKEMILVFSDKATDKPKKRTEVHILKRKSSGEELCRTVKNFWIFPETDVKVPANSALLSGDGTFPVSLNFTSGQYSSLKDALKSKPSLLLIYNWKPAKEDSALLDSAVRNGLKVLWLEAEASGNMPLKLDAAHKAAFAFKRNFTDKVLSSIDEDWLKEWGSKKLVSVSSAYKPDLSDMDILLDCGSQGGLTHSPLIRVPRGNGYYLICQIPLASEYHKDASAPYLLNLLLQSLSAEWKPRELKPYSSSGSVRAALDKAGVAYAKENGNVLLLSGRETLNSNEIAKAAESGRTVIISGINPESAGLLSKLTGREIKLEKAVLRQVLRKEASALSDGLSNDDLCWMKGYDIYDMLIKKLKGQTPKEIKTPLMAEYKMTVSGEPVESPFEPAVLISIPYGKGKLVISSVLWEDQALTDPVRSTRYIAALLKGSGCRVTAGHDTETVPVDISKAANRDFWHRPEISRPGWFGNAKDDMRYFPVNVTGNDPVLNMPQPPEKFPEEAVNYAGFDFKMTDPAKNSGKSCIVLAKTESVNLKINSLCESLLMLGALSNMLPAGSEAANVKFIYADGTSSNAVIKAGVELDGYQYYRDIEKGVCAWTGRTPSRQDAVIWCWKLKNPEPRKLVASIRIESISDASIAIAGISLEKIRKN